MSERSPVRHHIPAISSAEAPFRPKFPVHENPATIQQPLVHELFRAPVPGVEPHAPKPFEPGIQKPMIGERHTLFDATTHVPHADKKHPGRSRVRYRRKKEGALAEILEPIKLETNTHEVQYRRYTNELGIQGSRKHGHLNRQPRRRSGGARTPGARHRVK